MTFASPLSEPSPSCPPQQPTPSTERRLPHKRSARFRSVAQRADSDQAAFWTTEAAMSTRSLSLTCPATSTDQPEATSSMLPAAPWDSPFA